MPKTKPFYIAEFKREVLANQASTANSLKATTAHLGVSANSPPSPVKIPRPSCADCGARIVT